MIGEFARLLRSGGRPKSLCMLAAYCDESGKHKEAPCFVIAGLRANVRTWEKLSREWDAALRDAGVRCFHASECENGYGEFRTMLRSSRQELQERLIGIIGSFGFVSIALSIPWRLHAAAVSPVDIKRYQSSPYFFLFHGFVGQMVQHPHGAPKKGVVNFFFDRQDEFSGTAKLLYDAMKDERGYPYAGRIGGLVFASKTDPLGTPLQAADLFVYEAYKFLSEPHRKMRAQSKLLFGPMHRRKLLIIKEWNEEGIKELHRVYADRLDRALGEAGAE